MQQDPEIRYNRPYLEDEIRELARRQVTGGSSRTAGVTPALREAREVLTEAYRELALDARKKQELSTAGEWLIDNFYIIQEQLVQLREDLPPSYYRKLPVLSEGDFAGLPRIYELVQRLAALSDNIIDRDNLTAAVQAFQEVHSLSLGELWAVPVVARLVLIKRLRNKAEQLIELRRVRKRGDEMVRVILQGDDDEPGYVVRRLAETVPKNSGEPLLTALARRLQISGMLTNTERDWFDYRFRRWNSTLEDELRIDAQRTSRLHLSIQNAISTLRRISESDWADFVEHCSLVERILRLDPSGTYPGMDFRSRDRYRKVVESLAERSDLGEEDVARKVLLLAEQGQQEEKGKEAHVGYFLVGEGYGRLVREVDYRMPVRERLRRWGKRHPSGYFGLIGMQVLVLLAAVGWLGGMAQLSWWLAALVLAAVFFPALDLAVVSTHRLLTLLLPPRILPKMDFEGKVPDNCRTLVVVPTLFGSPGDVREQFEDLEIRALANSVEGLQFALLSDFTDHDEAEAPGDRAILEAARKEVERLNRAGPGRYGNTFFLLHRRREWNEREGVWMGWERKRGKLEELNRLLRDPEAETTYDWIEGGFLESVRSPQVRYVISLDADTRLPPGSALDLVNAAAHPLNAAEIADDGRRVTGGYGIFQPRISILPSSAGRSWFSRIYSGNVGLDPYTTAVSDVYQDLFGEGVYTGKGLYDVDAFYRVLDGRFPENSVLSHDLLESSYLRCALLTDIELFDEYPTTYRSYARRNHRWIRGDWQLLPWLGRQVPDAREGRTGSEPTPLNAVSRWKIFDNLRRSLNPIFLVAFLLLGWTVLPGSPWMWTAAVLGIVAFPIYSSFSLEIFARPSRVKWKLYVEKIRANLSVNTVQALTTFIFLPHQARVAADAVSTTLRRLMVTGRHMLEWRSASHVERTSSGYGIPGRFRYLWVNPALAALTLGAVGWTQPMALLAAVPVALGWSAAPLLSWYLDSRSPHPPEAEPSESEREELRGYARRTWHYFECCMNVEHGWLPPDNYQEEPYLGAVGRTSPTNMGLALASACVARDLGYLTLAGLLDRLEKSLRSMRDLERYQGHFFNWYSTRLGEVLAPRYVSTVDSGNLAAALLYVKQFLLAVAASRETDEAGPFRGGPGLGDTLRVLGELRVELEEAGEPDAAPGGRIHTILEELEERLQKAPDGDPDAWERLLDELQPAAGELASLNFTSSSIPLSDHKLRELDRWFEQPLRQVEDEREALHTDRGKLASRARELAGWCGEMVRDMDFGLLFDRERKLFRIGFNQDRASLDEGTYDLLASEARLASFIAIAKGEVPPEHWFRLSRRLTSIERNEILLSWGGTMFEYLMPRLFLASYPGTLLDDTCDNVVDWQQNYARGRGRPWGFSESAYGVLNLELHYQYRAFGVPGLGLRRGLAEHYIVSPYSSMLALMVHPGEALQNLRRLREEGAYGLFGFYEAVDYSSPREEDSGDNKVVRMFMAHHQGMSLLAMANVLDHDRVQELFHREPLVQSCELLLQERIPRGIPIKEPRPIDVELEPGEDEVMPMAVDHAGAVELDSYPPRVHILSNGSYSVMLTHAGTGYSWHNELALTRWRADRVKDAHGFFIYVRDLEDGEYWSAGYRPVNRRADRYDSWFHPGKVQTARVDNWIETFTEVCVSPEDPMELRKVTLTNYSNRRRVLELTSYAEVVLNQREADAAHPAFSNLFMQTDHIPEHHALLARRRPRSAGEKTRWLVHTMAGEYGTTQQGPLEFETDRTRFVGRGRSLDDPAAMDPGRRLSGTVGNVTDPVLSLRRRVELGPGEKVSLTFGLGYAEEETEAVALADRYDNPYAIDRVFELASIYGRVELEHTGLGGEQAHYFQKLAGAMLYGSGSLRADEQTLRRNRRSQSGLWPYSISGDLPILLYRIENRGHLRHVERVLRGHALWRMKGFRTDLVIVNDHPPSYINELQDALHGAVQASMERRQLNRKGGVFLLRGDQVPAEDQVLLETVSAAIIRGVPPALEGDVRDGRDSAGSQDFDHVSGEGAVLSCHPARVPRGVEEQPSEAESLRFYNGYGGFTVDGSEYVVHVRPGAEDSHRRFPPAPWVNVIANPDFGFITSERGSDYTWSVNSRENRLTPWSNDSVIDPAGEALYVRDEDHGWFWSPTPGPTPGASLYEVRHGFGYSTCRATTLNLRQEVTRWVDPTDPVKIVRLRLVNEDLSPRTLSVFHYLEWVMGVRREQATPYVVTQWDAQREAVLARNHYNNEFAGRVAFSACFFPGESAGRSHTGDRVAFVGRNRGVTDPRALSDLERLDGRTGAGMDPCAASQLRLHLRSGETAEIYVLIGESDSEAGARELLDRYRNSGRLEASLASVRDFWREKLGSVQIQTPAPELDLLFNGWLQYQNIACRMWGRSGFYQSGGAFGFRDQLQDAVAALYADPGLARRQILRHAAHQFPEGDVLHWWHPPSGRGIRSRISDDLLWLPLVAALYAGHTGDRGIWNEQVPFVRARELEQDEHEAYLEPRRTSEQATLLEHCCRAVDRSLETGPHGLPLIGAGDWNDGMNRVGEGGRGESVWLGFFLCSVLDAIIPVCEDFGEEERVRRYREARQSLERQLDRHGWDGEWFRRAYYDDGTPLGSAGNVECRIDVIAQAWSFLSGAADPDKAERALDSAVEHLVSEEEGIIRLLTPPFDRTEKDPGYIKGYIPGVRENGGQYTHGALWLVMALAESGRLPLAVRLMRMLTPVRHADTRERAELYRVEPYAVAADIYGEPPLTGMGGWTWYTGSAGWMYRVILESLLGLSMHGGNRLKLRPGVFPGWEQYQVRLRHAESGTEYRIGVVRDRDLDTGSCRVTADGDPVESGEGRCEIELLRDGGSHEILVRSGGLRESM